MSSIFSTNILFQADLLGDLLTLARGGSIFKKKPSVLSIKSPGSIGSSHPGCRRETLPTKAKVLSPEPFGRRGILNRWARCEKSRETNYLHPKKHKMAIENQFKSEIHLEMVGFPLSCLFSGV